jgi:transcriptional regulator with XRE-family HTH domain
MAYLVGQKVKQLRVEHGYSMKELGQAVNLSESTISRLEKGKANPTYYQMMRFALTLGTRLDDFLPEAVRAPYIRRQTDLDPGLAELVRQCRGLKLKPSTLEIMQILIREEVALKSTHNKS